MNKRKQSQTPTREARAFNLDALGVETRSENKGHRLNGHAAVFDSEAELWPQFRESIAPGAFTGSLQEDDIRALFNHNMDFVLGRNRAGTLRLEEDGQGLAVEIDLPDTQAARDLRVSIERGDINQMSFGFQTRKQEFTETEDGTIRRRLLEVKLFEVSPVTFPAYPDTDVAARAAQQWQACNQPALWRRSLAEKRWRLAS